MIMNTTVVCTGPGLVKTIVYEPYLITMAVLVVGLALTVEVKLYFFYLNCEKIKHGYIIIDIILLRNHLSLKLFLH